MEGDWIESCPTFNRYYWFELVFALTVSNVYELSDTACNKNGQSNSHVLHFHF